MSMTKGTPASSQIIFLEQRMAALESENENLRTALKDVLFWAAEVAGDTMDMEAREIEIASVERAIAVLGKSDVEV